MLRHLFPPSRACSAKFSSTASANGVTKASGTVSRRSIFNEQRVFKHQLQQQQRQHRQHRARFTNFETNVPGGGGGVRSFSSGPSSSSASNSKDDDVNNGHGADEEEERDGGLFSASRVVAKPGEVSNRWRMAIPAFAAHLCIGSPYAWSAMSAPLAREFGFVCSSASDWSMSEATMPLSIVFALQGISAAAAGKWQMRVGARTAMSVAAACFGGGLIIGAAGIYTHTLPLVYLGYGFLGGCGVGIGYTPPLQALLEWFPDKKGLASGLCIAGFGSGALLFAPASTYLMQLFSAKPTFVGAPDAIDPVLDGGRFFAEVAGDLQEVVLANQADLAKLPYDDLLEGYYVVGSGNTGAAAALGTLGLCYLSIMLTSAFSVRRPPPGYKVASDNAPAASGSADAAPALPANIPVDGAMKTPQFMLLATSFFCLATGGIGLFSVAKPMMSEVFSSTLPTIVTASFASSYLLLLSAANLGGRIGWAAASDTIGRRNTFHIFTGASIPLYLAVPYCVQEVVASGSTTPLYGFMGATFFAITMMGGTYALLPAYEADLFGAKYVGAIHGRMLLASTAAALVGPSLVLALRGNSEAKALDSLLAAADPEKFQQAFGTTIENAQELIAAKTVTIAKLMDIVPVGTQDPTPFIYDTTCYAMAGLMAVALTSHAMVRALDKKQVEKYGGEPPEAAP